MTDTQPYLRGLHPGPECSLDEDQLLDSLEATYVSMAAALNARRELWTGWKLGGTNAASRAVFGVDKLYYGALAAEEILTTPTHAPCIRLHQIKGEVEIALRVADTPRGYDRWCLALEMPASPILNLPDMGVRALVADRCAAGALVLGSAQDGPLPGADAQVSLHENGQLSSAATLAALTDPPEQLLSDFKVLLAQHALHLRPGDWVATGGITACCDLAEGSRVQVALEGKTMLDFICTTTDMP